jgi:hypothetical protein
MEAAMSVLRYFKTVGKVGTDDCPQTAITAHRESNITAKLRVKILQAGIGWEKVFMILKNMI